jgi:hypothetical protein
MFEGGDPGHVGDGQDRGTPIGLPAGLGDPGIDSVDHQIEQLRSVDHVIVEPHRTDAELIGELANRQSIEAVLISHPDRRSGDLPAVQRHRRRPRSRFGPLPDGFPLAKVRCIHTIHRTLRMSMKGP